MKVLGISWVGVKTDRFAECRKFFEQTLGLDPTLEQEDFVVYRRLSGDTIEIFGPGAQSSEPDQFGRNQIVVGLLVDDIEAARREVEAAGARLLGDVVRMPSGYAWQHFVGPDGNTWELVFDPEHPSLSSPGS